MAHKDEYKAAVVFLCSDASPCLTGANPIIDGGARVGEAVALCAFVETPECVAKIDAYPGREGQ